MAADRAIGLRIRLPLDVSVPRLLTTAGYAVRSTPFTRSTRILFDTGDRRLAAAGAELSLNRREGWRWRRDTLGHPKLSSREWTGPVDLDEAQVAGWARAYRRGRPLAARATVTVQRRRHQVSRADNTSLLTIVEERVDEQARGRSTPRARHVEVIEASPAAAAALEVLRAEALEEVTPLALINPRLVRAPHLVLPAPQRIGARDLFVRSATLALLQWLYFDCELPAGTPEALRKLRIALRRLRSDLQTFAPLLDRAWAAELRAELGELGGRLGSVRDGEVLGERLAGLVELLPRPERAAAQPLLDTAGAQFAVARAQLVDELDGSAYVALVDRVTVAVTTPRWRADSDDVSVGRLVRRPLRRLRAFVGALRAAPDDAQLHRIRILAKRTRYAADMAVPVAGDAAAQCAARLAVLQTVLGEHHDAVVTRQWLQRQADAVADVSFIAGELAALELRRIGDVGAQWREAWDNASRPEGWRWLRN